MSALAYRRVLLKISGEGLAGSEGFGIGSEALGRVAGEIASVHRLGAEVAVVVGGGNILRGESFSRNTHIPEATAHYMGMLSTVINALALQETLEGMGLQTRVLSSLTIAAVCEPFIRRRAVHHLEKGRVVILAAGTGRPFVTTDTAAALSSVEIEADALFKATQVDGVYSADPKKQPDAQRYTRLTYDQVIDQRLKVMDVAAVDMCQRNKVPIVVLNHNQWGNMAGILQGQEIGTLISK